MTTRELRAPVHRRCASGCVIAPQEPYLVHERTHPVTGRSELVRECLRCAAANGRPGYSDPAAGEQPLDLGGIA